MSAENTMDHAATTQQKSWKERILTIELFTVITYLTINNICMYNYAMGGVITSIERRFHVDSTTMGTVLMAQELGPLGGLLFFSYFSSRFNVAHLSGILCIVYSIGLTLFTLPEYILRFEDVNTVSRDTNQTLLCVKSNEDDALFNKDERSGAVQGNSMAIGIMCGALLLSGMALYPAYTLTHSYIEKNTKASRTTFYISIAHMGTATAPLFGLLLSAWCTSFYVDLKETSLKPEDPAWIGAWWLAILIVAGLVSTPSLVYFCFPKTMDKTPAAELKVPDAERRPSHLSNLGKTEPQMAKQPDKVEKKDTLSIKGFLFSIKRLFMNPVYVLSVCGYFLWAQFCSGFESFSPKVYQEIYSMTSWEANIAAALVIGIGATSGQIITGVIASRQAISLRKSVLIIIWLTGVTFLLMVGAMFMGCDNVSVMGTPEDGSAFIIDQACAYGCDCSGVPFSPICDAGVTYFSPCHAGCLDNNITTDLVYTECTCTETGIAMSGVCESECKMLIPYSLVLFVVFMLTFLTVPFIIVFIMRCVEPGDRALAFGLATFFMALAGLLPGPALSGSVIDTACLVWEDQGGGLPGSCWLYDIVALRQRFHGLGAAQRLLKFLCFTIAYLLARKKFAGWEERNRDKEPVENPTHYSRRLSVLDTFNVFENERAV